MENLGAFLPLVLIVLLFWVLVIRPARKRQQELSATQSSVAPGTEVMLGSGIYGTVVAVADDTVDLEISPGTHVKVARQAVVRVVTPVDDPADDVLDGDAVEGDRDNRPSDTP